jgi:aryl-alcohol dehydrogenase-like predicted oxidoreductase
MQQIKLGRNGPTVSAFGLGCMGMSGIYGPVDDQESIATIHAALDAGIALIDTGDFYGMGHNEMLIRDALKAGKRDRAFIMVKCGSLRSPDGKIIGDDARPQSIKNFLSYSLRRLGTDYIDLYQPSRVDPAVPIEDTIGAIADMVKSGYVRHIGVSEASAATVRRAHATHPIAALQIEYSLFSRGIERDILPTLRELGIALVAYGVLSNGLISDRAEAAKTAPSELRTRRPRFSAENFSKNIALVEALGKIARDKNVSTQALAFAWVKSRGDDVVPLIGARRRDQLKEALRAADLKLSADDLARIEQAVPSAAVAGARYMPAVLAHMDSEHAG